MLEERSCIQRGDIMLNGVDIASYQKDMNCRAVDADFIIIKVSQGTSYTNPDFRRQARDTFTAGKLLGLYHYATGCGAIAEANYFLENAKEFLGNAILCLDWEHNEKGGKNPIFGTSGEVQYCRTFADRIHDKCGVWPFIYMSASVTRRRDWSLVSEKCPLWVAQYPNYNITGYKSDPWKDNKGLGAWGKYWKGEKIRQYSSCGTIRGYAQTQPHKLDLDIAYMTPEEWKKFSNGTETPVSKPVTPALIVDVLADKYGSGASRIQNLEAAGYNAVDVQKKINELHDVAVKKVQPIKNSVGEYWSSVLDLL